MHRLKLPEVAVPTWALGLVGRASSRARGAIASRLQQWVGPWQLQKHSKAGALARPSGGPRSPSLIRVLLTTISLHAGVAWAEAKPASTSESTTTDGSQESILWPTKDEVANVPVCWAPPIFKTKFAFPGYAPSLPELTASREAWVKDAVEREWNGRTVVRFVGWKDCQRQTASWVVLTPMDSSVRPPCGPPGTSCVEQIGRRGLGKRVYLNLFFGDEFIYDSRAEESRARPRRLDDAERDQTHVSPMYCAGAFSWPWSPNSLVSYARKSVDTPTGWREVTTKMRTCVQVVALHEFGHIVGFAHRHLLRHDKAGLERCERLWRRNHVEPPKNPFQAPLAIRTVEAESIMSYCRESSEPTLTPTDVEITNKTYRRQTLIPVFPSGQ